MDDRRKPALVLEYARRRNSFVVNVTVPTDFMKGVCFGAFPAHPTMNTQTEKTKRPVPSEPRACASRFTSHPDSASSRDYVVLLQLD